MNKKIEDLMFYEIYPNSFMDSNNDGYGDINGIISKLDYIQDLGLNAIWLNPHFKSAFKDGGYDIIDYYHPSERFGTDEDFKNLIDEVNKRGMKLIIDLVIGHTSEECPMFIKSASPLKTEYDNLYIWTDNPWKGLNGYKFLNGRYDRYGSYMVNFFSTQPALNYGWNKITEPSWQMSYKDERTFKARNLVIDICKYYLEMGVSGFRVDMADSLVKGDDDKTATIEVWNYIFKEVKKQYKDAIFISEWCNPYQSFKAGFDADFLLDHHNTFQNDLSRKEECGDVSFLKLNSTFDISSSFRKYEKMVADLKNIGYTSFISGNHDTPRIERNLTDKELRLFYMILYTLPGIPFLYYGDEIKMKYQEKLPSKECGFERTGSRTPMCFTEGYNKGFSLAEKDKLFLPIDETTSVEKQKNDKNSIYYLIKDLIKIRLENVDLKGNNFEIICDGKEHYISYRRNNMIIIINPSDKVVKYVSDKNIIYKIGDVYKENGVYIVRSQGAVILK